MKIVLSWASAILVVIGCEGSPSGGGLVIEPGTARFTFPVFTTYGGCPMVDGQPCTPPPLPPGAYFAVLVGDGQAPLPPAATAVSVVRS
jgi:hypothetical protein